jgi:hypothetical protein
MLIGDAMLAGAAVRGATTVMIRRVYPDRSGQNPVINLPRQWSAPGPWSRAKAALPE